MEGFQGQDREAALGLEGGRLVPGRGAGHRAGEGCAVGTSPVHQQWGGEHAASLTRGEKHQVWDYHALHRNTMNYGLR